MIRLISSSLIAAVSFFSLTSLTAVTASLEELASFRLMTADEQQEALDFMLDKTQASAYQTFDNIETTSAVTTMREDITSTPSRHFEFAFGLNRMLLELFGDAHTRVEINEDVAEDYYGLNLCLSWIFGEDPTLVSSCETDYAHVGDLIVSLGGLSPAEMFLELQDNIPHENTYFLEALPQSWIVREDFLAFLGVLQDDKTVDVILERDGVALPVASVPLMPNAATPDDDTSSPFVSYEIRKEDSTAIFTLNACIFNQEYLTRLEEFWTAVKETDQIDTVVLDLRQNRGGDFTVAPAFLKYLAAATDSYELFDIRQRQSENYCDQYQDLCAPETLGFMQQLGVNTTSPIYDLPGSALSIFFNQIVGPPPTEKFDGELYVMTSGQTFSSGHLFAGVVQANALGELIGTPTGNTPSFWGNVINFPVPNTDLTFYFTTSLTKLSAVSNPDAIHPDELVETTPQDLKNGRDAQLDWVLTRNIAPSNSPSPDPNDSSAGIQIIHIGIVTYVLCLLI